MLRMLFDMYEARESGRPGWISCCRRTTAASSVPHLQHAQCPGSHQYRRADELHRSGAQPRPAQREGYLKQREKWVPSAEPDVESS